MTMHSGSTLAEPSINKLDLKLLKQSIALAMPYWFSEESRKARWLLVLLVLLMIGETEFNVLFNEQSGEFTSALAARDAGRFWHSVRTFFGLLLAAVPIYAYYYYVRDTLGLNWRRWLTNRILRRYFMNHAFYKLLAKPEIDNPDQRISQDIASYTQQALSFLLIFGGGVIQLVAFGRVLWSISGYLVLFVLVYATLVTLITFGVFSGKLVALNFNQRRREADFRFGLVRIRENAESIALYHGEQQEQAQAQRLFGQLFANFTNLIRWQLRLNFFQYPQSLLLLMLPSMVIARRVLSGELEVGRIVQAEGAFAAIMSALTILVDNVENLSLFAAGVSRVAVLAHSVVPAKPSTDPAQRKIVTRESEHLRIDGITLQTPNYERTLVKDLTVSVPPGEGLMIVGASGLGKSSLLRMIAGLWDSGSGTIERPKLDDILFLPQDAYMIIGSLRCQLLYPNLARCVSDAELGEVLDRVSLPDLVDRCGGFDVEFDFEKILSVGERQRLAFARVLLKHPRYVLLDEATSALDRENEASLYRQLIATSTTFVSVSHHPALLKYHSQVLELMTDGGWRLQSAAEFRFTQDLMNRE